MRLARLVGLAGTAAAIGAKVTRHVSLEINDVEAVLREPSSLAESDRSAEGARAGRQHRLGGEGDLNTRRTFVIVTGELDVHQPARPRR